MLLSLPGLQNLVLEATREDDDTVWNGRSETMKKRVNTRVGWVGPVLAGLSLSLTFLLVLLQELRTRPFVVLAVVRSEGHRREKAKGQKEGKTESCEHTRGLPHLHFSVTHTHWVLETPLGATVSHESELFPLDFNFL